VFDELTRAFFGQEGREGLDRQEGQHPPADPAHPALPATISALLLVDARHPGLDSDRAAWQWLHASVGHLAIVATKIDKLARGERIRALRELESVFEHSVLPVSAVTGEGLDQLWTLIERLNNSKPAETAPQPLRTKASPPRRRTSRPRNA
jgi:predicted GTPase